MSKISINNEDVSRIEKFVVEIFERTFSEKWNAYEVLMEECNKKKFRQAIESAKDFERLYNDKLRKDIKKKYETWLENEDCPSGILEDIGATNRDDESWQNAKLLEGKIEEILAQSIMKEISFPQFSSMVSDTDPVEIMKNITEAYKKDKKKIGALLDEVERKEKEVDDDMIFKGVCALLEGILKICKEFFDNRIGGTKRLISDNIKPGERAISNALKDEKRDNKTAMERLNDSLIEISELFKGSFL